MIIGVKRKQMSKDFHETYSEQEAELPSERSTGFVFAGVSAIIGAFYWDDLKVLAVCAGLSLSFLIVSLVAPFLLGPLNRIWFRFSLLVNKIVNPIILGLMFAVAIIPVGFLMRLKRDPLRSKPSEGPTYWIDRKPNDPETHSMTNQF
jgi:hypothetical protein